MLARSLFEKYHDDFDLLERVLDAYEPAANRIANTVAVSFVEERERVIREQADALRELSTSVLHVRERLLILPIIGVLDNARPISSPTSCCGRSVGTARGWSSSTSPAWPTSTNRSRTTSCRASTRHV